MRDGDREEPCDPIVAPVSMAADVAGYRWARDKVGQAGGAVYRLHGNPTKPDLFLKQGRGDAADEITDEMARLLWLNGHLPAPSVVNFVRTVGEAWMLTTAVPGQTAAQALRAKAGAGQDVVDGLARFMRRLHAVPVNACPFNGDHAYRLVRARARIDADLVDADDFDTEREGWTAEDVWTEIQTLLPLQGDRVVTHGDFSLDNLMIREGEVTGCIDVGRMGVADRYQDLAILWNSLGEFGPELQARLLEQYGVEEPDQRRLRFHLLLDELF